MSLNLPADKNVTRFFYCATLQTRDNGFDLYRDAQRDKLVER
jgi:hypothetical protein